MQLREYDGVNAFLKGTANELLNRAVKRHVRGFNTYELPHPVIIKINNPRSRLITVAEREWNIFLPFVESLWLASGRNDMAMIGHYLKKMYDFSDDKETMRAAYGPRLRFFNGVPQDYQIDNRKRRELNQTAIKEIDQFEYIIEAFRKDPFTRQAIISIIDPAKDFFGDDGKLKITKDFPCTTSIQFIRNQEKLDLIVQMRSNDFLWGASAVNIFNFTFIQEYFSHFLQLEVGNYYHIVNNLHYYENLRGKVEQLASISDPPNESYAYEVSPGSLQEFDVLVRKLEKYEFDLRIKNLNYLEDFGNDFFNDWAKMFYAYHHRNDVVHFANPILEKTVNAKKNETVISKIDIYGGENNYDT